MIDTVDTGVRFSNGEQVYSPLEKAHEDGYLNYIPFTDDMYDGDDWLEGDVDGWMTGLPINSTIY